MTAPSLAEQRENGFRVRVLASIGRIARFMMVSGFWHGSFVKMFRQGSNGTLDIARGLDTIDSAADNLFHITILLRELDWRTSRLPTDVKEMVDEQVYQSTVYDVDSGTATVHWDRLFDRMDIAQNQWSAIVAELQPCLHPTASMKDNAKSLEALEEELML